MSSDTGSPCPSCRAPAAKSPANPAHPFCSPRCKLNDLAHWLEGTYRVPGDPVASSAHELDHLERGDA